MADLITREFGIHGVRILVRDGEPWFAAADVCRVLDIGNPSQAITRLDDDESTLISGEGLPPAGIRVLSESGLYALVLGSRKPDAKVFKRWVTHDVLPSIRKTGSYVAPTAEKPAPLAALNDPSALRGLLLGYTEKVLALEAEVSTKDARLEEVAGAIELHERIETASGQHTFIDAAKMIGVHPGELIAFLLDRKYVYRRERRSKKTGRLIATERWLRLKAPLFYVAVSERFTAAGESIQAQQTYVTPAGLERFAAEIIDWTPPAAEGVAA